LELALNQSGKGYLDEKDFSKLIDVAMGSS
jgi:hypothetical protein